MDYLTAGESHGRAVIAVVSGFPAGYDVDVDAINSDLALRQGGHGRSARQKMEKDKVEFLSGLRRGVTLGSPVTMAIFNKDVRIDDIQEESVPRPGHAELAGALKFGTYNVREISERASARETAARVAAGSLARQFLKELDVEVLGFLRSIGADSWESDIGEIHETRKRRNASQVYCPDKKVSEMMAKGIDKAMQKGDTLGGTVEVVARGAVPGLGSCMSWQERLDGRLAQALMSIQAVKGIEVGSGFSISAINGFSATDPIAHEDGKLRRISNRAGGIEGGMTNGEDIVLRAWLKPIPTTNPPAPSVDLKTGEEVVRQYERSDICAVPAGAIIAEAAVSFELMREYCRKFGADSNSELKANLASYKKKLTGFFKKS